MLERFEALDLEHDTNRPLLLRHRRPDEVRRRRRVAMRLSYYLRLLRFFFLFDTIRPDELRQTVRRTRFPDAVLTSCTLQVILDFERLVVLLRERFRAELFFDFRDTPRIPNT